MTTYRVFLKIILFGVLLRGSKSESQYVIGFSDRVGYCPDFENDVIKASLQLAKSSDGETDSMSLAGSVECKETFGSGHKIGIDIAKETDVGSEPMWSCSMDLCNCIEDEDAPWASMFQAVNIYSCPIEKADYPVENLVMDSSFTKDFLNEEYVGNYGVQLTIKNDKMDTVACHTLSVAIKEEEVED